MYWKLKSILVFTSVLLGIMIQAQSKSQTNDNLINNNINPANAFRSITWPDTPEKLEMLRHSASLLNSAIDFNQIELVRSRLTNQPTVLQRAYRTNANLPYAPLTTYSITNSDIVTRFESFVDEAKSDLAKVSNQLVGNNLHTYISPANQYCASASDSDNTNEMHAFVFYGKAGPVEQFEVRIDRGTKIIAFMEFYENGKLKLFSKNGGRENLKFFDDGRLSGYFVNLYPHVAVELKLNNVGKLNVLSYNSKGLTTPKLR